MFRAAVTVSIKGVNLSRPKAGSDYCHGPQSYDSFWPLTQGSSLVEKTHQSVLNKFPEMARIVREYGDLPLQDYAESFFRYRAQSIQPRDDFIEVVSGYARRLLGGETAALLERHFSDTPVALTANHHGVDYKSLTVHGTIIFALPRLLESSPGSVPVVPVLAFGIVPLNNFSFPRGIILSREKEVVEQPAAKARTYRKVPVIPVKFSQTLVSVTGPITTQMVSRALGEVERLFAEGAILESERKSLSALLREEYAGEEVLSLPDYSDQAVVLNRAVWKRIFAPPLRDEIPDLAYLEMERVAAALLEKDIRDADSMFHNLLFDPLLREELLHALEDQVGCWNLKKLDELSKRAAQGRPGPEDFRGCGTAFFWQVDQKGRRVPLMLTKHGSQPALSGITAGGEISVPLTPKALCQGLRERKLLPCLFSSFAVLAFARGIKCLGGFYQVDYLPAMQRGLLHALESRGFHDWAKKIALVPTANFVTGMNIALVHYPNGETASAGAIEIAAAGGLTQKNLEGIKTLTVEEANLAGLMETYPEFIGDSKPDEDWFASLKALVLKRSGEKLARIRL